jgi:hypothetical protein
VIRSLIPSHRELLRSKSRGGERRGNGRTMFPARKVERGERKQTASKSGLRDIKTRGSWCAPDRRGSHTRDNGDVRRRLVRNPHQNSSAARPEKEFAEIRFFGDLGQSSGTLLGCRSRVFMRETR